MGKIYLVKGSQKNENTDFLLNKIQELHKIDQSSEYLFLGSSGGFLHEVREKILDKTEAIFNNSFKVINQYVVEEIKRIHKDKIHIDNNMLSAFVMDVIEDNNAINDLLNSGNGIVELFMTYYSVINEYSSDKLLAESQMVEDELIKEFAGIYAKFEKILQSNNMYSTYDAYRYFTEAIQKGQYQNETKKRVLFVDGFDDLSNLVRNFLANFTNCFEESYITIPCDKLYNVTDSSFEEFISICKSRNFKSQINVKDMFINQNRTNDINVMCDMFEYENEESYICENSLPFQIAEVQNPHEQIMITAALVKELVLNEQIPLDNIAVITRDLNKSGNLLADVFEKFGIPYRFEGDVPIMESININRLILPFRVFYSGFDPELILSYIESGFVDLEDISFAEFETVFKHAGLAYGNRQLNKNYYFSSYKSRKNEWFSKIKKYKTFVFERKESLSNTIDEQFDEDEALTKEYNLTCKAEKIIRNAFQSMREMFSSSRKVPIEGYEDYFRKQYKILEDKNMLAETEFEQIAVMAFFEKLLVEIKRFFIVTQNSENVLVNPVEYWKYLNLILQDKTYHSSSFIENRCMIMDLEASRYRNKDIKIYIDVLDGKYPKTKINKIYEYYSIDGVSLQDSSVHREERNFILSLRNTNKKVIFIYPLGDISGNPLIRSFFVDRLLSLEEQVSGENAETSINASDYGEFENYSAQDYLIDKLNKIDFESEEFEELCSTFKIDWQFIKQNVDQKKANDLSAFTVENKDMIKELFGETLSPSKYGVLNRCYREFYFKYLLKIRFDKEDLEGFDYATEGQILHSVLHSTFLFFKNNNIILENMEEIEFEKFFEEAIIPFICSEIKAKMFHPEKTLFDAEVVYFRKLIYDFLKRYRSSKVLLSNPEPEKFDDAVFLPTDFEVEIGKSDGIKVFEDPDIYLIGKIDRVDKNEAGDLYIYDYKRSEGSATKDNAFQLMLYAYAEKLKGNSVKGMAFLPVKSKLKKVSGAFLTYDEDDEVYYLLSRGKPDKKNEYSFEILRADIVEKINRVFSGNLEPDEEPGCYRCDLEEEGLCFLRRRGDL